MLGTTAGSPYGKDMSADAILYEPIDGELHRHGAQLAHAHPHAGPHVHDEPELHDHPGSRRHGHSHGLVHDSIKRSREGLRAVALSLGVLGLAALAQTLIFVLTNSVALLADLIHNFGDALTAVPLGIAFFVRSARGLVNPQAPSHLVALAAAGAIGYCGNWVAARVRMQAGHRLDSPALIADGNHARADAYVSLSVVASAAVVAIGLPVADPLIGLAITAVILRITWQSWRTVRGDHAH